MNHERIGSPAEFIARLGGHLAAIADPASPLPEARELAALVEAAFFASLHEEEARRTEFSIAWETEAHDCASVIEIAEPVRATPKNLAKLAPATIRDATSIAVRRDGEDLVAWALLERAATTQPPLTIRVLGSGVLRVDYAGLPRALYARGETYLMGGEHEVISPARALSRTFADWRDAPSGIDMRAAVIARIAARCLDHRHGGMILIVPASTSEPVGVRVHYGVASGSGVLSKRLARVVTDVAEAERLERLRGSRPRGADGRVPVRDEAQLAFADGVDLLARLTAIDNAVLLDTDLKLRAFGVQVLEGDTPAMSFEHADPYSTEVHVDDLSTYKGTRHPAGVIFCMRQPAEAAAIIASQDGRLSLAVKSERGVQVIGGYERAFGWLV